MAGRKPKPTYLKLITGNPGKRRMNPLEPRPEAVLPAPPEHLTEVAKGEWTRLADELFSLGLLTRVDRACLAGYCQAYADWVEAEAQLLKFGKVIKSPARTITRKRRDGSLVTETSGGYPIQSPFLAIRNKALELMHKFAVEFGMSPSSRSKVSVSGPAPAAADPAQKYLD